MLFRFLRREGQEERTQGEVEVISVDEHEPSAEKPKAVSEDPLAALQALLGDFNLFGLENPKHLRTQSFLQAEVLFVKSHWANPSNSVSGTVRAGLWGRTPEVSVALGDFLEAYNFTETRS